MLLARVSSPDDDWLRSHRKTTLQPHDELQSCPKVQYFTRLNANPPRAEPPPPVIPLVRILAVDGSGKSDAVSPGFGFGFALWPLNESMWSGWGAAHEVSSLSPSSPEFSC